MDSSTFPPLLLQLYLWANQLKTAFGGVSLPVVFPVDQLRQLKEQGSSTDWALLREQRFSVPGMGFNNDFNMLDMTLIALGHVTDASKREIALTALGLMLDMGFDPNRYNGLVTPVGYAGYSFQTDALRLFATRGADLRLELALEHTPQGSGLGLTTLLHRIGLRASVTQVARGRDVIVETIAFLARDVPTSVQADENGLTVLTDPSVPQWFKDVIIWATVPPKA